MKTGSLPRWSLLFAAIVAAAWTARSMADEIVPVASDSEGLAQFEQNLSQGAQSQPAAPTMEQSRRKSRIGAIVSHEAHTLQLTGRQNQVNRVNGAAAARLGGPESAQSSALGNAPLSDGAAIPRNNGVAHSSSAMAPGRSNGNGGGNGNAGNPGNGH